MKALFLVLTLLMAMLFCYNVYKGWSCDEFYETPDGVILSREPEYFKKAILAALLFLVFLTITLAQRQ
jgi:hypothetical protein